MTKTYSITVRLTQEQKEFIDKKITHIKEKVDIEVPAGLVIRKMIQRAMLFHEAKCEEKERGDIVAIKHFFQRKFGKDYKKREEILEELLNLIEEYKASETE